MIRSPLRLSVIGALIALICPIASLTSTRAVADEKITICHAALINLPSFERHIADLHQAKRYEPDEIEKLVARKRTGGAEFFTSQIMFQEHASGSGTYDLRLFHGLSGPYSKYRNITPWACTADDYPIAYFVGFRVQDAQESQILVARERAVVSVVSLKKLSKPVVIKAVENGRILCEDVAFGCVKGIWFDIY
jgi:hypothetical protein